MKRKITTAFGNDLVRQQIHQGALDLDEAERKAYARAHRWDNAPIVGGAIALGFIFTFVALMMSACAGSHINADMENVSSDGGNARFVDVSDGKPAGRSQNIVVDTETGVQYLFITNGYNGYMSVILDADGNPILDPKYANQGQDPNTETTQEEE